MIQETFTTNFMAYRMMTDPATPLFFIPVGHAQLLLFSYPASLINDQLFSNRDIFTQFYTFGLIWHVWSGAILFGAILLAVRECRDWPTRLLVCLAPLATPLLSRSTNLGLHIGYDRAETLIVIGLLPLLVRCLAYGVPTRATSGVLAAALLALAAGIKLTFGAIVAPFVVLLLICDERARPWHALVRAFVATSTTLLVLLSSYVLMDVKKGEKFVRTLGDFLSGRVEGASLIQRETTILQAFDRFLNPSSWYFSLQLAMVAAAIALVAYLVFGGKQSRRRPVMFAVAVVVSVGLEMYFLSKRLSMNSMFDVINLTYLIGASSIAFVYASVEFTRFQLSRLIAHGSLITFIAALVSELILYDHAHPLRVARRNSEEAIALRTAITAPGIPIVYYHADYAQPLMFPDPGILLSTLLPGPIGPESQYYGVLNSLAPGRLFNHDPTNGLVNGAHVAVVPEFFEPNELRYNHQIVVFDTNPKFAQMRSASRCKIFDFHEPQHGQYMTHYMYYTNQVTVCVVKASTASPK
jgi:hypothetical protein